MKDLAALSEALLSEIERELDAKDGEGRSVLYRAHRVAIMNWLGRYRPLARAAGEDRVRGFEEAYYHLRSMIAYKFSRADRGNVSECLVSTHFL